MISTDVLKKQLSRLMRLPYMPRDPDSIKGLSLEFTRVLRGCCRSDIHCALVVDAVMDAPRDRVLAPGDVIEAARSVVSPDASGPPGCLRCAGTGWFSFQREVMTAAGEYLADYASFCRCARGHWMRESDQRRKEESMAKSNRGGSE
jgi:hypothetical protein